MWIGYALFQRCIYSTSLSSRYNLRTGKFLKLLQSHATQVGGLLTSNKTSSIIFRRTSTRKLRGFTIIKKHGQWFSYRLHPLPLSSVFTSMVCVRVISLEIPTNKPESLSIIETSWTPLLKQQQRSDLQSRVQTWFTKQRIEDLVSFVGYGYARLAQRIHYIAIQC